MDKEEKIIIYQVLPRLFGNNNPSCTPNGSIEVNGCGKIADFTNKALTEIKKLGITHIWYTGIIEHATQTDYQKYGIQPDHPAIVKGKAGSPYAIKDYYDVDPDLASNVPMRIKEFERLVERTHKMDLKVIIDFVPNHVARQYHSDHQPKTIGELGQDDHTDVAFSPDNNFYYIPQTELKGYFDMQAGASKPYREYPAKATGNDRFDATPNQNDWYETVKLNYGVDYLNGKSCHFYPTPSTWQKMLHILLFWAQIGVDGFRCDMAEMVPVEFWQWAIPKIKQAYPGILFIAEVYNPSQYHDYLSRGNFDYLYDKVGLYDTLRGVVCGYTSATEITRCWQSLGGIEKQMLNFLENHDEQRIASEHFAGSAKHALPAIVVSACMNTNPFMIYFGQELGEKGMDTEGFSGRDGRTTIFDYWSLDTLRRWRDNGHFSGKRMTDEQRKLRAYYQRVLTLCNKETAIQQGEFFDLMYANTGGWRFNEHRQYAFLRKKGRELLFIVANFDPQRVDVCINVPLHAFEFLKMQQIKNCMATDLLTGCTEYVSLQANQPTEVSVEGYNAKILKIVL